MNGFGSVLDNEREPVDPRCTRACDSSNFISKGRNQGVTERVDIG
jgi:hypothetical protein